MLLCSPCSCFHLVDAINTFVMVALALKHWQDSTQRLLFLLSAKHCLPKIAEMLEYYQLFTCNSPFRSWTTICLELYSHVVFFIHINSKNRSILLQKPRILGLLCILSEICLFFMLTVNIPMGKFSQRVKILKFVQKLIWNQLICTLTSMRGSCGYYERYTDHLCHVRHSMRVRKSNAKLGPKNRRGAARWSSVTWQTTTVVMPDTCSLGVDL